MRLWTPAREGNIVKDNAVTEVVQGLKAVAAGQTYLCPSVSGCLLRRRQRTEALARQTPGLDQLTPMERRVLKLVADNKTSREIGKLLLHQPADGGNPSRPCVREAEPPRQPPLLQFALAHRSEL